MLSSAFTLHHHPLLILPLYMFKVKTGKTSLEQISHVYGNQVDISCSFFAYHLPTFVAPIFQLFSVPITVFFSLPI